MAQIKEYTSQVDVPSIRGVPIARMNPGDGTRVSTFATPGADEFTRGARHLAYAMREREEEDARAWSAEMLSRSRLDWQTHLTERQAQAKPGAYDFTPGILSDFDKYSEDTLSAAPTPVAREFLKQRLLDLRTSVGTQASTFEANARIDHRVDQFTNAASNVAKLMGSDPTQYQVALSEQLAVIDASALPPIKKSEIRQKTIDRVSEAAVQAQIQRSPTAFLESIGIGPTGSKTRRSAGELLGQTGNLPFDAMAADKRVKLFDAAIRQQAQLDSDAAIAADKMRKQISDDSMKEAWNRLEKGKLKMDYVESIRPFITHTEYRTLLKEMRPDAPTGPAVQKTDPATFRELQSLLYTDPEAAAKFAMRSHQAGLLSNENLSQAMGRARDIGRAEGPKSPYERNRQYIVQSMDPGPMVPDPVGRSRMADAIQMFDTWVKDNPKVSEADLEKRAREVVGQHKLINFTDTSLALPQPRSGTIRRNADPAGATQDIVAAANNAKRKLANKQITQKEYEDEMAVLNRWRTAVDRVQNGR
jgi:hypothetical protein